jgi:hypothetical protein
MAANPQQWEVERRGGKRVRTKMFVRVIGRDSELVERSGNIAASGFFFEAEDWQGRPGDIVVMEVASEDKVKSFTTLARVARVTDPAEARRNGINPGVSFQFLPSDESTRRAIARTFRHIAEQNPDQMGDMVSGFENESESGSSSGVGGSTVVESGAHVLIAMDKPGEEQRTRVIGVVGDITESVQSDGSRRFWVPVYYVEDAPTEADLKTTEASEEAPEDVEISELLPDELPDVFPDDAMAAEAEAQEAEIEEDDELWTELVPECAVIESHLSGQLSKVSLPSALWLLDQERLTGVLEVVRPGETILLYLREGCVIDATCENDDREARKLLGALMGWPDGDFEFRVELVDREDVIGIPTQSLLLDLAVESDEEGR